MSAPFVYQPATTFSATAKITVPGIAAPQDLPVVWRILARWEQQAWIERVAARSDGDADADGLLEVMADWSVVDGQTGSAIAFSKPALREFLAAYPAAGAELVQQYIRQVNESRLGN